MAHGTIPYEIDPGFNENGLQEIREAIDEWNSKTVITLVQRTTEPDFVHFIPRLETNTCSSYLGRQGGEQSIALGEPDGCGVSSTIHEIGHAVGLGHEHQRRDRDEYVTISKAQLNGLEGPSSFFYRPYYRADAPAARPYDYASVMNYYVGTIPPGIPIRESGRLSAGDIDGVARMYGSTPTATTVSTNPPGLEIIVDGERVIAPASFDWSPGTAHSVRAPLSQTISPGRMVFAHWNDGGNRKRTITAGPDSTWFEANYIEQRRVIACAVPEDSGQVTVRPESDDGFYTVSTPVEYEAIADSGGAYEFMHWSFGASPNPLRDSIHAWSGSSEYTAQIAVFSSDPLFRIEANVEGTEILVNGKSRHLPWAFAANTFPTGITVEAPERQPEESDWTSVRARFDGWSDGGSRIHKVDVPSTGGTLSLDLTQEYWLNACEREVSYVHTRRCADDLRLLRITPQSGDGFYARGTQVQLTAAPPPYGLHFAGWTGVASHTDMSATVVMDDPRNVEAVFTESEPLQSGAREVVRLSRNSYDGLQFHAGEYGDGGYSVLVPPDATELEVSFQASTIGAEVDLYVRRGSDPVLAWNSDRDSGTVVADFESRSLGADERVVISRTSTPSLANDTYHIGFAVPGGHGPVRGTLSVKVRRDGLVGVHASPQAFSFVSATGIDPAPQDLQLEHDATRPARYRIDSDRTWLRAEPREWVQVGSGTAGISVLATSAGLAPGPYEGTLTVARVDNRATAGTATSADTTVPVFLAVIPPDGGAWVPEVNKVVITSQPRSSDTYGAGETIELRVELSTPIAMSRDPGLEISVGGQARRAVFDRGRWGSCAGYEALTFRYTVQPEDNDPDGIGIAANALALNEGTISSAFTGAAAKLDLGAHAIADDPDHRVNGSKATAPGVAGVWILSRPHDGSAYGAGEEIRVQVDFSVPLEVSGSPTLAVGMGDSARLASLEWSGDRSLVFRYAVQAGDRDADGISIGADALALSGGSIRSASGADAVLDLGSHAVADASDHKVDGSITTAPEVSWARFLSSPQNGTAYGAGEEVRLEVEFSQPVEVAGEPQLALRIGSHTRQALLHSGYVSYASRDLYFAYTVQAEDTDANGISVAANALSLNGGTISSAFTGAAAKLDLGAHAIADDPDHRVNGSKATAPGVAGVWILSRPHDGSAYGAGEEIRVQVDFSVPLEVSGSPTLAVGMGDSARLASLEWSGDRSLVFRYAVQAGDRDADGISIGADALALSGGSIRSASGADAVLDLGSHAVADASDHKVDGSITTAPEVSWARFLSSPQNGTAYGAGEEVRLEVEFSQPVEVAGEPQLALRIGSHTRQALLHSGYVSYASRDLYFAYTVQAEDTDANGISVAANALSLNGGTISSAFTGAAAKLDLGAHAIADDPDHKVGGGG